MFSNNHEFRAGEEVEKSDGDFMGIEHGKAVMKEIDPLNNSEWLMVNH